MARTACGLPPAQEKRSGFSLKSLSRSISSKVVTEEVASSAFTQLGLGSSQDEDNSHSHATAYTPSEEPRHEERTQAPADRAESASAKRGVVQSISASRQSSEPETRTYKGSTYVKGADGEWHLQQPSASARVEEQPRVVEQPRDLMALEQAGVYRGLYHVLLGRIAPLDGIGPEQLTIDALVRRLREGQFKEIIMATNPTVEGEATANYLAQQLRRHGLRVTRIAMGIPVGSDIEYTDEVTMLKAMEGRREM